MSSKLLIFLIGSLLLVNHGYTAPTSSSEEDIGSILKGFMDAISIFAQLIGEFLELHKMVQHDGKAVLEKVIKDPKVLAVKSEAMEEQLKEIREYIAKLDSEDISSSEEKKESDKKDSKGSSIEYLAFEELVNKYKKEKNENLSPEEEIIGNSLKENGLDSFEEKIHKDFKSFVEGFIKSLDSLVEKLSDDEKKGEENKLVEWLDKLKAATDMDQQLSVFAEFLEDSDESK